MVWCGAILHISSGRVISRYSTTFALSRGGDVARTTRDRRRITGRNVAAWPVPHYIGPLEYLKVSRQVNEAVRHGTQKEMPLS